MDVHSNMLLDNVFFICITFLRLTDFSVSDGNYYVSEVNSTWNEIGNVCPIGEPSFQLVSGEYVVQLDNIANMDNDGVWTGYFEIMEYFDNIGCLNEVSVHSYNTELCGSPGQCFQECGYGMFFGLMALKCFCFKKDPMSLHASPADSNCSRSCNSQPGVGCGGPGFVSVYKFNSHARQILSELNKTDNQTNIFCLQVDPTNWQYSWSNCSEPLAVICDFDGIYLPIAEPLDNQLWIVSANACFSQQGLLVPLSDNLAPHLLSETWTRVIRSPAIYKLGFYKKLMERAEYKADVIRYGILTRRNNRSILTFTEHSSDRKVLCFNDSKESSLVEIVVGVSIAAAALMAATITKLIIERRRKQNPKKTKLPANKAGENSPVCNHPPMSSQMDLYESMDVKSEKENDGKVLMSKTVSHPVGQVHCNVLLEHVNPEDNDEVETSSDAICYSGSNELEHGESAYDKCYIDRDSAYDHVCISGQNVSWIADTTYDTTSNVKY